MSCHLSKRLNIYWTSTDLLSIRPLGINSDEHFSCDQAALWMVQSVRPSARHTFFHYVPIIVSSWNFQELLPMTEVMSMQKVKVKGQGNRGQNPT